MAWIHGIETGAGNRSRQKGRGSGKLEGLGDRVNPCLNWVFWRLRERNVSTYFTDVDGGDLPFEAEASGTEEISVRVDAGAAV